MGEQNKQLCFQNNSLALYGTIQSHSTTTSERQVTCRWQHDIKEKRIPESLSLYPGHSINIKDIVISNQVKLDNSTDNNNGSYYHMLLLLLTCSTNPQFLAYKWTYMQSLLLTTMCSEFN